MEPKTPHRFEAIPSAAPDRLWDCKWCGERPQHDIHLQAKREEQAERFAKNTEWWNR